MRAGQGEPYGIFVGRDCYGMMLCNVCSFERLVLLLKKLVSDDVGPLLQLLSILQVRYA